jgi:hypothetical protein
MKRRCEDYSDNPFPSWSWVGWKGVTELGIWRGACDYVQGQVVASKKVVLRHTVPTVEWHILDTNCGKSVQQTLAQGDEFNLDNIPISLTLKSIPEIQGSKTTYLLQHRTIEAQVYLNHTAQSGVSLQRMIDPNIAIKELPGPSIHASKWRRVSSLWQHPCNPYIVFKYPIPIASDFDIPSTRTFDGSPYLTGRTTTAQFWCRAQHGYGYNNYIYAAVYDSEERHEMVGEVYSNDYRIGSSEGLRAQDTLTFVAISEGYSPSVLKDDPQYRSELYRIFIEARYVNVLWVEQVGNISYRRGVGRISKKFWEGRAIAMDAILG